MQFYMDRLKLLRVSSELHFSIESVKTRPFPITICKHLRQSFYDACNLSLIVFFLFDALLPLDLSHVAP